MSEANIYRTKLDPSLYLPFEFQWIEINFAPLRPTGFGNFHRAGKTFSPPHWAGRGVHPCYIHYSIKNSEVKYNFSLFCRAGRTWSTMVAHMVAMCDTPTGDAHRIRIQMNILTTIIISIHSQKIFS